MWLFRESSIYDLKAHLSPTSKRERRETQTIPDHRKKKTHDIKWLLHLVLLQKIFHDNFSNLFCT